MSHYTHIKYSHFDHSTFIIPPGDLPVERLVLGDPQTIIVTFNYCQNLARRWIVDAVKNVYFGKHKMRFAQADLHGDFDSRNTTLHLATYLDAALMIRGYLESAYRNFRCKQLGRKVNHEQRLFLFGKYVMPKVMGQLMAKNEYKLNKNNIDQYAAAIIQDFLIRTGRGRCAYDLVNNLDMNIIEEVNNEFKHFCRTVRCYGELLYSACHFQESSVGVGLVGGTSDL